jgi:hypothetical protein
MAINEDADSKLEDALNDQDIDLQDIKQDDRNELKEDTQE